MQPSRDLHGDECPFRCTISLLPSVVSQPECHERARKPAPSVLASVSTACRSTSGAATAVHSTSRPTATHASTKSVTSAWPSCRLKTGEQRNFSGFMSVAYCCGWAVASATLTWLSPASLSRCAVAFTPLFVTSPLVLSRRGTPRGSSNRADSSSTLSRNRGSPIPANAMLSYSPFAAASTAAAWTSLALGVKPSGSGAKPLSGGMTKPGPRDAMSDTVLHELVSAR
mmetsp:Transcript_21428/g.43812  ORF Transcript_21428/g.43812 Transcript_21428/m.43812 type:complete len:227 (-) Transcript_21428:137-817(-)